MKPIHELTRNDGPTSERRRRVQRYVQCYDAIALADLAIVHPDVWPALTEAVRADGPQLPRGQQSMECRAALDVVTFAR